MHFKPIGFILISLLTLIISSQNYANTDTMQESRFKTNSIINVSHLSIQAKEKSFDFDWNNYKTIASNKNKIDELETYVQNSPSYSSLNLDDQQALGKLLYKMGTYYTHVARKPDLAIKRLNLAAMLLKSPLDIAWNNNHLAYAYELKYAANKNKKDFKQGLAFTNQVIKHQKQDSKVVAFTYCVQGLLYNDANNLIAAESSFKKALNIYEKYSKDDQYARSKNRLANILLDQNRNAEALTMLEEVKQYWLQKKDISLDPYAARNFISLGQAYLKLNKPNAARVELNHAIKIYKNVYGQESAMLSQPYLFLARAYQNLGQKAQANAYNHKLNLLSH